MGTTLRTEIYSSEDEYEMVNLYTYLSHKKAHNILPDQPDEFIDNPDHQKKFYQ